MNGFVERWFPNVAAWYYLHWARVDGAKRLYDAAQPSVYRPRRGSGASGDAVMSNAGARLRELARYYDENHDLTIALLDDLVNCTVGAGLAIEPMVRRARR